jgi:hypothetical protein
VLVSKDIAHRGDLTLLGKIGAFSQHSQYDVRETTRAARSAFLKSFENQVDPESRLSPEERARRAEAARKAYFARLALRSAQARRSRKAANNGGQR